MVSALAGAVWGIRCCSPSPDSATTVDHGLTMTARDASGSGTQAQLWKQMWCFLRAGGMWHNHAYLWILLHSKAIACNVLQQFLWNSLLCEMSLLHSLLQSRILCPYLDIKEMDLIVSPLKQAFNSILWGIKTLLNNWAAKRLVISVFIAHIDLSVVNPFKYPCHTGPDGSL